MGAEWTAVASSPDLLGPISALHRVLALSKSAIRVAVEHPPTH
jgi:hypothetical protein